MARRRQFIPNSKGDKNVRRTIERVTRQQRNSAENREYYQSSREWALGAGEKSVLDRRARIARSVPMADFVPGISHKGHPADGYEKGVSCDC